MNTDVESTVCSKCREVKLISEFHKNRDAKAGHHSQCKTCKKEQSNKHYAENSEKVKVLHTEYYLSNAEKVKARQSEYYAKNTKKIAERHARYYSANPDKGRARISKRRAIKLLAIPSWLTKEDYRVIEDIYVEAKRLEVETGLTYHVDHIIPLQGKLICGFHCPDNLQILTKAENLSKHNKFIPYVESELYGLSN